VLKAVGAQVFTAAIVAILFFYAGRQSRPIPDLTSFHRWYYDNQKTTWDNTYWLGVPLEKCPLDLHIYQEILYETKPDVLIECGTYKGGSAYFFASMFDLLQHGKVITIDVKDFPMKPQHPRITYLVGSSVSPAVLKAVKASIQPGDRVMVSLDSDHHKEHVLKELEIYAPLVTLGNYLVVEDTNLNGHPVVPDYGPGPAEALEEFLRRNPQFQRDPSREKFGLTFSPGGYLKRVR
jgi:cephalosporin hydroxylase